MKRRTKAELLAWIEQHQPVTREKLFAAFEDMDYEQLQGWLSELQSTHRLFEVNPESKQGMGMATEVQSRSRHEPSHHLHGFRGTPHDSNGRNFVPKPDGNRVR